VVNQDQDLIPPSVENQDPLHINQGHLCHATEKDPDHQLMMVEAVDGVQHHLREIQEIQEHILLDHETEAAIKGRRRRKREIHQKKRSV